MALERVLRELKGGEAMPDWVLAHRLGIPLGRVRDALLILAAHGYVEAVEAAPGTCGGCPLKGRCAHQRWRLRTGGREGEEVVRVGPRGAGEGGADRGRRGPR